MQRVTWGPPGQRPTQQSADAAADEDNNAAVQAEVYDTDRFGQLYAASQNPPLVNLGLAARFLAALFQRHAIPYAFLGGWAVYLRGSQRVTKDVDVTVDSTMNALQRILKAERRLCVPQVHGQTSIQIFVHTGGIWDQQWPNARSYTVSTDVIIKGNMGTPTNLREGGIEALQPIPPTTPHGSRRVNVITLFYQVAAKLSAHTSRRADTSNDYDDLEFLIRQYPSEVWNCRGSFDPRHLQVFWLDLASHHGEASTYAVYMANMLGLSDETDDGGNEDGAGKSTASTGQ